MQECILRKVIGEGEVACKLAQKIAHLGLMTSDEFAVRGWVLIRDRLCDKFMVVDPRCSGFYAYRDCSFRAPNRTMIRYAIPIANGNAAPARQPRSA